LWQSRKMNDNYLTAGALVLFVSAIFLVASTADIPFYAQDISLRNASALFVVIGLLLLSYGLVSARRSPRTLERVT
jgi:hypothetical protein